VAGVAMSASNASAIDRALSELPLADRTIALIANIVTQPSAVSAYRVVIFRPGSGQ